MYACMYVCMHVCMLVCMATSCTHVYIQNMYIYIYVCVCVYVCVSPQRTGESMTGLRGPSFDMEDWGVVER